MTAAIPPLRRLDAVEVAVRESTRIREKARRAGHKLPGLL